MGLRPRLVTCPLTCMPARAWADARASACTARPCSWAGLQAGRAKKFLFFFSLILDWISFELLWDFLRDRFRDVFPVQNSCTIVCQMLGSIKSQQIYLLLHICQVMCLPYQEMLWLVTLSYGLLNLSNSKLQEGVMMAQLSL